MRKIIRVLLLDSLINVLLNAKSQAADVAEVPPEQFILLVPPNPQTNAQCT